MLSHEELLALAIDNGGRSLEAAKRVFNSYGLRALCQEKDLEKLMKVTKISKREAILVIVEMELCRRAHYPSRAKPRFIREPVDIYRLLRGSMEDNDKECLYGMYMEGARILHEEVLSVGTVDKTFMRPREVLAPAMVRPEVTGIILAHNHINGDPTPSKADIENTKKVIEACKLLSFSLIDHIIIGKGRFESVMTKGHCHQA